jgi:hypothetical protein
MRELAQSASKRKTSDAVWRDDVNVIDMLGAAISAAVARIAFVAAVG